MTKQKYSTTNKIIEDAQNGSLKACFRLSEMYREGKTVVEDIDLSKFWSEKLEKSIDRIEINIRKIHAIAYRGFDDLEIEFEPNSTLLVGANGSGKSNLLDCCALAISWITSGIANSTASGSKLNFSDICNKNEFDVCSISIEFELNKTETFTLLLEKSAYGSQSKSKSDYTQIKTLSDIVKSVAIKKNISFPIFIYYNINRSGDLVKYNSKNSSKYSRFSSYLKSLHASRDFSKFQHWLIETWIHENSIDTFTSPKNEIRILEIEVNSLSNMFDLVSENSDELTKNKIKSLIEVKRKILDSLKNDTRIPVRGKVSEKIFRTITTFIPDISNFHVKKNTQGKLGLFVEKRGVELEFQQLSQGENTLFCLVGDIVRRIVTLNGENADIENSYGIILIDEIDLHLHPLWQQSIIPSLTKIFRNIQFIFSTHSPQVVSTANNESIRLINEQGARSIRAGTNGANSARVLKDVFKADPRPQDQESAKKLKEFLDLVYNKLDYSSTDFYRLKSNLESMFGHNDPDFTEACIYAETLKWEADHEKNK